MMSVVPFNVMGSEENVYDKDARWWSTPYESVSYTHLPKYSSTMPPPTIHID